MQGSVSPPADLEGTFRGQVLRPRDEGYEAARRVFNAMIDPARR